MRPCAAAVAVLGAAAIAGCGGSGRLSSSDLANQATQICALASKQTDRIKSPINPTGSAVFLRQGITALTPELAQLRKLHPPADAQDVYTTAINSATKKLALLRTASAQLAHGDDPVSTLQSLEQQLAPVVQQENGAWQSLGIPACVNH
jgi:hypothetical protein